MLRRIRHCVKFSLQSNEDSVAELDILVLVVLTIRM